MTEQIYDRQNYGEKLEKNEPTNYYLKIRDTFKDCGVITTNYTPFVELYFGTKNSIYLGGRLSEFEFPCELSVKDIRNIEININNDDFIFPFLMTQAPIKPIIVPSQIKEYGKALSLLQKTDILVIIGYSLCEADNHINAIL